MNIKLRVIAYFLSCSFIGLMLETAAAPLGYFPPSWYSNYRGSGGFWNGNKRNPQTLTEKQVQLVKATLKELSKAGISKAARSMCVKTIMDAVLSSSRKRVKGEARQLEQAASCCAEAGREDLAEEITHCSLRLFAAKTEAEKIRALDNLAGLKFKKGSCDEAVNLLNEALEIERRYSFQGPSDTGILLNHLAQCYAQTGKYEQAEKVLNRAIATDREKMGENSFAVAEDLYNLGVIQHLMGDKKKAEQSVKSAIDLLLKLPQGTAEQKDEWSKFYSTIK